MRSALVYVDSLLAGRLYEEEDGFSFLYFDDYLSKPSAKPVSLTLPLRKEAYKRGTLFPFFDGLIPEGWLLELALKKWGIEENDRFGILLKTGRDVIGNVSVLEEKDE